MTTGITIKEALDIIKKLQIICKDQRAEIKSLKARLSAANNHPFVNIFGGK